MDNYNKMDNTYYEEPIPSPDKLVDNPYEEILDKQPPIPPRGGSARHGFSNTGPPRPRAENKYEDVPLPTSRPTTNGNAPVHNGTSARLPMWRKPSLKNQKSSTPGPTCCQLVWWQWLIVVIYTVVSIAVIVLFILRFTRNPPQEEGMTAKLTSQGSTGMQVPEGSPVGPPGPPGVLGPPGLFGATGSTGPPGFNGAPGMSSTGQNGATGYPGRVGATGLRGRPGIPGFPGAKGSPGFPGGAGAAGFPGPPGQTGATGAAGADSSPGATGSSGLPGSPGRPGSTHLNDECEQSNGGCAQICVDMYDGYYCACRKEYQLVRPTQTTCNPGNNMKCRTTLHGKMCWCDVTKTLLNGTRCTLRTDLCASRCEQKCISGPPVTCACQSGFTLNPDKETCSDVNECTTGSPCSSNAICINSYGSHYCLQP